MSGRKLSWPHSLHGGSCWGIPGLALILLRRVCGTASGSVFVIMLLHDSNAHATNSIPPDARAEPVHCRHAMRGYHRRCWLFGKMVHASHIFIGPTTGIGSRPSPCAAANVWGSAPGDWHCLRSLAMNSSSSGSELAAVALAPASFLCTVSAGVDMTLLRPLLMHLIMKKTCF